MGMSGVVECGVQIASLRPKRRHLGCPHAPGRFLRRCRVRGQGLGLRTDHFRERRAEKAAARQSAQSGRLSFATLSSSPRSGLALLNLLLGRHLKAREIGDAKGGRHRDARGLSSSAMPDRRRVISFVDPRHHEQGSGTQSPP